MHSRLRLVFFLGLFFALTCSVIGESANLHAQNYKRSVVLEEFTGTWCGWCCYGAWNLDSIETRMRNRAVVISWHNGDEMYINAQDTVGTLDGLTGFPEASVDRMTAQEEPPLWDNSNPWYQAAQHDALKAPLVDFRLVNATYDPTSRKLNYDVDITPYNLATLGTEDTTSYVTVGVATEDGIVSSQHQYNSSDGTPLPNIDDFTHYNVARAVGGKVTGDLFTMGTKTKLTSYPIRKHYRISIDPSWSDAEIRAKAFVAMKSKHTSYGEWIMNADQTVGYIAALPTTPNAAAWVVVPHAGDNLDPTVAHNIIWAEGGSTTAVKLEYSIDVGASWKSIVASTTASPYSWTVPTDAYGKSVVIRITDASNGSVTSNSDQFQVATPILPTITVTSPSTGDVLASGTTKQINFSFVGPVTESKTLSYTVDSGATWSMIGTVTGTTTSFSWTVPTANTNTAFVSVKDGNNIVGMSGMFLIKPSVGEIMNVSVAGAPTVQSNSPVTISWTLNGTFSESLALEWSANDTTWNPIASGISRSTSSYSWTTPNQDIPQAWVRVSVASGISGVSNMFAIAAAKGVSNGASLPTDYALSHSYPNPSTGISTITYSLPTSARISLSVSDLLGREVRHFESNTQSAGTHEQSLDMTGVPNGTYVYTLHANDRILKGKLILAK